MLDGYMSPACHRQENRAKAPSWSAVSPQKCVGISMNSIGHRQILKKFGGQAEQESPALTN